MSAWGNIISASVGFGGVNKKPDVELIQSLLNALPFAKGGPNPLLSVDGLCGPKTNGAIKRFQTVNQCYPDGRIDPGYQTIEKLLSLLQALGVLAQLLPGLPGTPTGPGTPAGPETPVTPPVPGGGTTPGSNLRNEIKKWALIGANGPYGDISGNAPNGIVSDLDTITEVLSWGGTRKIRKGWKNLKGFFDETVQGWTENHWKAPGYLDGVKLPGKRVPQGPSKPSGVSWCGIFATWCWRKAGKDTKWVLGMGPTNAKLVAGNEGIQVGDICVQFGGEVHHFIPVEVNGDDIQGVNGNSDYQSILLKPMKRGTVNYYYRPE